MSNTVSVGGESRPASPGVSGAWVKGQAHSTRLPIDIDSSRHTIFPEDCDFGRRRGQTRGSAGMVPGPRQNPNPPS